MAEETTNQGTSYGKKSIWQWIIIYIIIGAIVYGLIYYFVLNKRGGYSSGGSGGVSAPATQQNPKY